MPNVTASVRDLDRCSRAVIAARADFIRLYYELMKRHSPSGQALPFKVVVLGACADLLESAGSIAPHSKRLPRSASSTVPMVLS